jgi:D-alanyl-D-alanine carboxypeptidase/D-alanyl-D-alanine-endopeptidase (penicillin-binding protein 4)
MYDRRVRLSPLVAVALGLASQPARSDPNDADPGAGAPADDDIEMDDPESPAGSGAPLDAPVVPSDPAARDRWLAERLTAITTGDAQQQALLGATRIGVHIVDLSSGKTLWSKDGDGRYNLASNTKLLTSATALARLGGGFVWRTAALVANDAFDPLTGEVKGDLYIRGRGDPTLTVGGLRQIAQDLRAIGVKNVTGALILDRGYFDGVIEPPHYDEQPKERAGFRAPIASFAVERNAFTIIAEPDPAGVNFATVKIYPEAPEYLRITVDEVLTIVEGRSRLRVDTLARRDHLELRITGQLRADEGPVYIRKRIDDPVRWAAELMKRQLADAGIRIAKRKVVSGEAPRSARILAYKDSAPLIDVVRDMNKSSDNYVAESVLKTIGAESRAVRAMIAAPGPVVPAPGPATWEDGLSAVRSYVSDTCQVGGPLRVENGSGLFGSTDVSPSQLVQVLACAHRDYRVGPDLASSLAVAGVDGTMGRRLRESAARGRIRAKTGTLASVTTVAGYAAVDSGRVLGFAILVNDIPPGTRGATRTIADAILETMIAYLDAK